MTSGRQVDRGGADRDGSPWKVAGVWPYLWAMAVDSAADAMFYVILAWVSVQHYGFLSTAFILGLGTVPRAVLLLFGGALGDRKGLLSTAVVTLQARAVIVTLLVPTFIIAPQPVKIVILAAASLSFGIVDAAHMPAMHGVSAVLVREEKAQTKLTGAIGGLGQFAEFALAPLAGFLLVYSDTLAAAVCAGLLVAAVIGMRLVVATIANHEIPQDADSALQGDDDSAPDEPLWRSVGESLRFTRSRPSLLFVFTILFAVNLVATAPIVLGVPFKAREYGWSGGEFGIATVGLALGYVLGSIGVVTKLADHLGSRPIPAALAFIVPGAAAVTVLGFADTVLKVVIVCAAIGLFFAPAAHLLFASIKVQTPLPMVGRVLSMADFAVFVSMPLGYPLFGVLSEWLGNDQATLALGVGVTVIAVAGLLIPRFWQVLDLNSPAQ